MAPTTRRPADTTKIHSFNSQASKENSRPVYSAQQTKRVKSDGRTGTAAVASKNTFVRQNTQTTTPS